MFSTFLQQLKIMPNLIIDFNSSELYSFQIFSYEIYPEKKKTRFYQTHNDDGASNIHE